MSPTCRIRCVFLTYIPSRCLRRARASGLSGGSVSLAELPPSPAIRPFSVVQVGGVASGIGPRGSGVTSGGGSPSGPPLGSSFVSDGFVIRGPMGKVHPTLPLSVVHVGGVGGGGRGFPGGGVGGGGSSPSSPCTGPIGLPMTGPTLSITTGTGLPDAGFAGSDGVLFFSFMPLFLSLRCRTRARSQAAAEDESATDCTHPAASL